MCHLPARTDSNSLSWPELPRWQNCLAAWVALCQSCPTVRVATLPEFPRCQSCRPAESIVRQQNNDVTQNAMWHNVKIEAKSWNAPAKGTKMWYYYLVSWTKCNNYNLQNIYKPHGHTLLAVLNRKWWQQKQKSLSQIVDSFHCYSSVRHSGFRLFVIHYYHQSTTGNIHNNSQYWKIIIKEVWNHNSLRTRL